MGCGVASNNKYEVSHLKHGVVLTETTGDAEGVIWDHLELGHSTLAQNAS